MKLRIFGKNKVQKLFLKRFILELLIYNTSKILYFYLFFNTLYGL